MEKKTKKNTESFKSMACVQKKYRVEYHQIFRRCSRERWIAEFKKIDKIAYPFCTGALQKQAKGVHILTRQRAKAKGMHYAPDGAQHSQKTKWGRRKALLLAVARQSAIKVLLDHYQYYTTLEPRSRLFNSSLLFYFWIVEDGTNPIVPNHNYKLLKSKCIVGITIPQALKSNKLHKKTNNLHLIKH